MVFAIYPSRLKTQQHSSLNLTARAMRLQTLVEFHLKPSRILYRINDGTTLDNLSLFENYLSYNDKHILLLDESVSFLAEGATPSVDLLVISKNPKIYIKKLAASLNIRQVVFDGSVPAWKANYWKKDCDSLHIPWHDVTVKGAFEMRLN